MPSRGWHPRHNDPDHPRMILARQRESQAWDLHLRGATRASIAETLGVSSSSVTTVLQRATKRFMPDEATLEERRMLAQARIDLRRLEAARVLSNHHPVLHQGRPVMVTRLVRGVEQQVPLEDDAVKLAALAALARCDDDEMRLWGLEAARKMEHAGSGGGAIPIEVRVHELLERTRSVSLRALPPVEEE